MPGILPQRGPRPIRLTCLAMPAAPWASAPQRWPCRGWSHTRPRCSPPWRSLARAACGAASLAKSAEGNFEPALTHREKRVQIKPSPQSPATPPPRHGRRTVSSSTSPHDSGSCPGLGCCEDLCPLPMRTACPLLDTRLPLQPGVRLACCELS